ncbi:MAG: polyprenyl synthetase family protein [Bacteroidota bacterium]
MIPLEVKQSDTRQFCVNELDQVLRDCAGHIQPPSLREAVGHALQGGKRIRPLMTMLVCDAVGGGVREALPVAAAIELLHTSSLIHDDIMDTAPLRRGLPTVHEQWDIPTAILAGDTLIALAFRLLHTSAAPRHAAILETFSEAFVHVCEGQGYDLSLAGHDTVPIELHRTMVDKKTAKLMQASARIGALIGTMDDALIHDAGLFGYNIGMAFQAQDDLLDMVGHMHLTGKSVGSDVRNGKQTYLTLAYSVAERIDVDTMTSIERTRQIILEHTNAACGFLEGLPERPSRVLLQGLARSLAERTW